MEGNDEGNQIQLWIATLESWQEKIGAAIGPLRSLRDAGINLGAIGSGPIPPVGNKGAPVDISKFHGDEFFGLSLPEAAKKYLKMVGRKRTLQDISEALKAGGVKSKSKDFPNTINSNLYRDSKKPGSEFVQVAPGEWGLAEFYPGMKRKGTSGA